MYQIDEQTVQALIQYLSTKPYAEVAGGIEALRNLKPITSKPEATNQK